MALTLDKVEALAPDQSSVDAARKLLKAGLWPKLAWDGADFIWGECQGSGSTPYRVVVAEADAGYKCTCPSRKFPCKHTLALMWMRVDGKSSFIREEMPAWVSDWIGRRRGPSGAAAAPASDMPRAVSLTAMPEEEAAPDEKALARSAAAVERTRRERETSVLAGLDELDTWLSDHVERGLAAFVTQSTQACRMIAQRLVDAKAPGLATRVDGVSARLFALPEALRAEAAVVELGQLHLLAEAYRRQDALSPELKADVRQAIGWTITRDALLADETALRVKAVWRVVGTLSEVQPDRLRRLETWLSREGAEDGPRFAVLIDYVPVATGPAVGANTAGDRVDAELVFYPSAAPLRALVAQSFGGARASGDALEPVTAGLSEAFAGYQAALGRLPWLGVWPLHFAGARVRRSGKSLFVCDAAGGMAALPLRPAQATVALPLVDVERLDAVGIFDGRALHLCWAETELGRWVAG